MHCLEGCNGWPARHRNTSAGVVVTCECGARRWRPETLRKSLRSALVRVALGERARRRLRAFWR